jgi:uncharacterized protein (UPF0297 family)/uncharacterized protein YnzC (UPF0291/DUF896 family)
MLTSLVGGVAAEAHPFPPADDGPFSHPLEQPPVRKIISVYGIKNGEPLLFREGNDFQLNADKQSLSWVSDSAVPDRGTLIYVNYLREDVTPSLTDLQVGSVTRTLTESIALEIARLYAQLEAVHKAGYIDTATGSSLDKVVSLLDVHRFRGTRPSAKIRFSRAAGSRGVITLQAGTRILDEQVRFEYETTETITMSENQNSVMVTARDLEPGNEPVEANTLTVLAVPVVGIDQVTNPGPASRAAADETDVELRTRAKNFLHGSERATLGALKQVLVENQVKGDIDDTTPGQIIVSPHGDDLTPEQLKKLETELNAARPAGIQLILSAPLIPLAVDLSLRLTTTAKSVEADLRAAHNQVREAIRTYFDGLDTRANASINQIVGLALAVDLVDDIKIEAATTREQVNGLPVLTDRLDVDSGIIDLAGQPTLLGELTIADSNLPTELDLVITFPPAADIPVESEIEAALTQAIAYLNTLSDEPFNPADPLEAQKRELSFGKLLHITPLPGYSAATIAAYDLTADVTVLPSATDRLPYGVSLYLNQASGITKILADDSATYTLTASEKVLLNSIVIAVEEN